MRKLSNFLLRGGRVFLLFLLTAVAQKMAARQNDLAFLRPDTLTPIWPNTDFFYPNQDLPGIQLPLPSNIHYKVEYNPLTGKYEVRQTIGDRLFSLFSAP